MAISYSWNGAVCTKKFDDGTAIEFDTARLPEAIREELMRYGFKQKSSDCHSQLKTDPERVAMTELQWEAFAAGQWNIKGGADRIMLESIDWEKLAGAVAGQMDEAKREAARDAVLAKRAMAESDDEAEVRKARKLVKDLLAKPAIAEAYGWTVKESTVDDLLGLD